MHRLPDPARFLAFAALGWLVGQAFTRETIRVLSRSLVPIVGAVVALLVFSAVLGLLLTRVAGLDPATSYLATSPGALSQMSAIAASVGADASVVVTVHTLRVVSLMVVAPWIGRLVPSS